MELQLDEVEKVCSDLYVRALKLLPPDIKAGFGRLLESETDETGRAILGTMVRNIEVAEKTRNILCQDTGIPIYNVTIGRNVIFDGAGLKQAIRRGPSVRRGKTRCAHPWCIRSPAGMNRPPAAFACR